MYGIPINRDLPVAALLVHEYPKVWLYHWQDDGPWLEEPRTVYDDTWHAHRIYSPAWRPRTRSLDGRPQGRRAPAGSGTGGIFIKAAVMAQVDPIAYGLMEHRNGGTALAPQPAEQWSRISRHELALRDGRRAPRHVSVAEGDRRERSRPQRPAVPMRPLLPIKARNGRATSLGKAIFAGDGTVGEQREVLVDHLHPERPAPAGLGKGVTRPSIGSSAPG